MGKIILFLQKVKDKDTVKQKKLVSCGKIDKVQPKHKINCKTMKIVTSVAIILIAAGFFCYYGFVLFK